MGDSDFLSRISNTPITELNFGGAGLRRLIKRAGYANLTDLLDLDEETIDDVFDYDTADVIISLREQFYRDPVAFAKTVLTKRTAGRESAEEVINRVEQETSQKRLSPVYHEATKLAFKVTSSALPSLPCTDYLKQFEE